MFTASERNLRNQRVESLSRLLFMMMTGLLILPVVIILATLVYKGGSIISFEFLFSHPTDGMTAGGILPALVGTVWLVAVALLASVPLGVAAAIYLSEYASQRARSLLKPILEVLAGIPTVVYGYFALTFMTPILRAVFGEDIVQIFNTGAAQKDLEAIASDIPALDQHQPIDWSTLADR